MILFYYLPCSISEICQHKSCNFLPSQIVKVYFLLHNICVPNLQQNTTIFFKIVIEEDKFVFVYFLWYQENKRRTLLRCFKVRGTKEVSSLMAFYYLLFLDLKRSIDFNLIGIASFDITIVADLFGLAPFERFWDLYPKL